jgi:hypothetical protein
LIKSIVGVSGSESYRANGFSFEAAAIYTTLGRLIPLRLAMRPRKSGIAKEKLSPSTVAGREYRSIGHLLDTLLEGRLF